MSTCPIIKATGVATAKDPSIGASYEGTFHVDQQSDDCNVFQSEIFFKIKCDTACKDFPLVETFSDENCTIIAKNADGKFKEIDGYGYKCGDKSLTVAGCENECLTTPTESSGTDGDAKSGAGGISTMCVVGMLAVIVAATTIII